MAGIMKNIWIKELHKQADGRYTLIFTEDGKTYRQENMGLCCSGNHCNDTGNDSDTRVYSIYFEVIQDFNPLKEEL